jgi:hypothetical protein
MPTSATDRALLLPHPLAVVAFAISQALFECDFSYNSFCGLQHNHRQRFILLQFVMKRAQINLWLPNFATGSAAWPHDTAIRTSMMRHNSLSEE